VPTKDCFVHRLKLAERELFRKKLKADSRILQLVAQAFEGILENGFVVEGQRWKLIQKKPLRLSRVGPRYQRQFIGGNQSLVGDRDYSSLAAACASNVCNTSSGARSCRFFRNVLGPCTEMAYGARDVAGKSFRL
jgi:hypothetical protein